MFLDRKDLIFVYETINEDDTNEKIIHKIIYNYFIFLVLSKKFDLKNKSNISINGFDQQN